LRSLLPPFNLAASLSQKPTVTENQKRIDITMDEAKQLEIILRFKQALSYLFPFFFPPD
jgi:hypothetical protein